VGTTAAEIVSAASNLSGERISLPVPAALTESLRDLTKAKAAQVLGGTLGLRLGKAGSFVK